MTHRTPDDAPQHRRLQPAGDPGGCDPSAVEVLVRYDRATDEELAALEADLEAALSDERSKLMFRLENGRAIFDAEVARRQAELRTSLRSYLGGASPLVVITAPFIYAMIVPLLLLDAALTVAEDGDPLAQLPELRRGELPDQLGLSRQHDLHELRGVGLEVRQQAHLFEGRGVEILCLVDNQHGAPTPGVRIQQVLIKYIGELFYAFVFIVILDAQFITHRGNQFIRRYLGIEQYGQIDIVRHLFLQTPAQGGLAGSYLAGQLNEAAILSQAVEQVRQRLPVTRAHEEEQRIRRDRERPL